MLHASLFLPVTPALSQETYATHGNANQALYGLDLASLLQGAIAMHTMGVRLPTSVDVKIKALSLTCSAKTDRSNFPFSPLKGTPGTNAVGVT